MYKTQKTTIANTDKAARALSIALDNLSWSKYFAKLVELCEEEERQHRGSTFAQYHPHAPGVKATGRFFAVLRIGEYLNGEQMPTAGDFLHFQTSAFQAAAIVSNYRAECIAALERVGITAEYLAGLDYSALVSPEDVQEPSGQI
jgi:hypothetical protein